MKIVWTVYQKEQYVSVTDDCCFKIDIRISRLNSAVPGAKIREFASKDKKYCFEIVAQGRKGLKKYSFLCETSGASVFLHYLYGFI